jgi:hypothetical protein
MRAALVTFLVLSAAAGCDGGGGTTSVPGELLDPTPATGNQFGTHVVTLANGNIVVTAPFDSSVASNNGALHLYNPVTQARIASIYGDEAGDFLGSGRFQFPNSDFVVILPGVWPLPNGNFVIVSPTDSANGILAAGSVRLMNGATGAQIGNAIAGDTENDNLGSGPVIVSANGNSVIIMPGIVVLPNGNSCVPPMTWAASSTRARCGW